MQLKELRDAIRRLPANVYRCKGFVLDAANPSERTLLQAVGRRVAFTRMGDWGEERGNNDIVAIGSEIDERSLRVAFAACRPLDVDDALELVEAKN